MAGVGLESAAGSGREPVGRNFEDSAEANIWLRRFIPVEGVDTDDALEGAGTLTFFTVSWVLNEAKRDSTVIFEPG